MVVYAVERGRDGRGKASALLEEAAALEWGMSAVGSITRGPHGKPFLVDAPHRHFNLSHSGGVAMCALDDRPVGIDVQMFRAPSGRLLQEVCAPGELAWLEQGGEGAFALLWALKESRCKWSGRGLTRPIREIAVPLPRTDVPAGCWTVLDREELTFSLWRGAGWWAAVCGHQAPEVPIRWLENSAGER